MRAQHHNTSWGLDLSTDPRKCAAVAISWDEGLPAVVDVRARLDPAEIVDVIARQESQFAVDVPFGWPDRFIEFLRDHRNHAQRPPGDRAAWRKEALARRATDQRLLAYGALPLPASFDRLGKTAVMWSAIEYDLREQGVVIDRSGMTGRVCETYPAAALAAWSLPKSKPSLELIEAAFPFLQIPSTWRSVMASDDVRDALVCALVARARTLGLTEGPDSLEQARREGWIHVSPMDPRALLQSAAVESWLSVPLYVPTSQDLSEDGPKTTFDFWRADGTHVDTLNEFAGATGSDLRSAALRIIRYAFSAAVPARLSREAWRLLATD